MASLQVGAYASSSPDVRTYIAQLNGTPDFDRPSLMPRGNDRKTAVVQELMNVNTQAMEVAGSGLNELYNQGVIKSFTVNPLSNTVVIDVPEGVKGGFGAAYKAINAVDGIGQVIRDRAVTLEPMLQAKEGAELADPKKPVAKKLEWNVTKMGADKVWEQGFTGKGVVVGIVDTGVDLEHPALKSKYRGMGADGKINNDYSFFDAFKKSSVPYDDNKHGTHVAGTVLGSTAEGYHTGMAPDARWIGAKILSGRGSGSMTTVLAGLEWMLAPRDAEGKNPDPSKAPDIVSNSWGTRNGKTEVFRKIWKSYLAAGIEPVVAAGNSGPRAGTTGAPGSYPESITVGATDKNDKVARFSSRGPSPITDGNPTGFKPDVSAPGHQVTSSVPGGGYGTFSGTSMATPGVSGVVALMLSKHKDLTHDEIVKALTTSAVDIDKKGPDMNSGHGRVDAVAAMKAADELVKNRKPTKPAPKPPTA